MAKHDEEHLRRFVAAREAGDPEEMRRWWGELVIDFYDRFDAFVGANHRGRLNAEEHDLAVSEALLRFSKNLIATFEGVSIGQLVNACLQLSRYACIDVQERAIRERERGGRSLDEGWQADAEDRGFPQWEAGEAARLFAEEEDARGLREFLDWALPQLTGKRGAAADMTFRGFEIDEISLALETSHANVHQLRSRAMKDLQKLKEQFDS